MAEEEKRKIQEKRGTQRAEELSIISISLQPTSRENPSESALEWRQISLWQGEQKKGSGRLNTASIWVFARSLMAREWARALGRKRRDPRPDALERQAIRWREIKEAEK